MNFSGCSSDYYGDFFSVSCPEAHSVTQSSWLLKGEFVEMFNFPLWRFVLRNSSWQESVVSESWCPALPELEKTGVGNITL